MDFKIKSISVIIPVFNSAETITSLHSRITSVLTKMEVDYEILFINDASGDNSSEVMRNIADNDSMVKCIDLNKNYGQDNATLCGIRKANYDLIVTLDDDLQNPPEEIPKLLEKLEQGSDVVYGYPKIEEHGVFRNLASALTKIALKKCCTFLLTGHDLPATDC